MNDLELMTSPEGDHAANGLAEVGVREINAQTRILRSLLEQRRSIDVKDPLKSCRWKCRSTSSVQHLKNARVSIPCQRPEVSLEHGGLKIKQQRRSHEETHERAHTSSKDIADVVRGDGRWNVECKTRPHERKARGSVRVLRRLW